MNAVYKEIENTENFFKREDDLSNCVFQGLNLAEIDIDWSRMNLKGAVFLGCRFSDKAVLDTLQNCGAWVFPRFPCERPYDPFRSALYSYDELEKTCGDTTLDEAVYRHMIANGGHKPTIMEALAQRIHDHAIDDALGDLLGVERFEDLADPGTGKKVIGIMGGHSVSRDDASFRETARLAWMLTRNGYFVVTGGGPGIMEAGNLGAYMAAYSMDDLETVLDRLSRAPACGDGGYHEKAKAVVGEYSDGKASLAIPTWFYGHEPSNCFASHIAKYFSNSIREDILLTISLYGIVFAPGSAGTRQEIFQDAAQNHYRTFQYQSPMVFLGVSEYRDIFDLLRKLAQNARPAFDDLLALSDDPITLLEFIREHPPRK